MPKINKGKVFLTGVGPGDESLITKAALNSIDNADVIIYDHLISRTVLDGIKKNSSIIYAGKSPGQHSLSQQKINKLLIQEAKKGKTVVRLKGGDPFLFGRGSEEASALLKAKIPFEIIPGVNSGGAVAAYAGIPLTHRGISSQVTFVTGHEDPKKTDISVDWAKLAKLGGTLVIFMGMSRLKIIIGQLIKYGMKKNTPICISQWGTLPQQKSITGTLSNIMNEIRLKKITNPSIVIIGEVVCLRKKLNWYESKPLFGKKILITRPKMLAREFSFKLEQLGAQTYTYPLIDIIPIPKLNKKVLISKVKKSDWIIFTSVNAVEICFNLLHRAGQDARVMNKARIAVLGEQTKKKLQEKGIIADIMPKKFFMENLINEFKKINIKGSRIFIPHSKQGRKVLMEGLARQGAIIDELFIYNVRMSKRASKFKLKRILQGENFDFITFTSSSGVHQFMRLLKNEKKLLKKQKFALIGPITRKTLNNYGYRASIVAKTFTIDGLIEEIIKTRVIND